MFHWLAKELGTNGVDKWITNIRTHTNTELYCSGYASSWSLLLRSIDNPYSKYIECIGKALTQFWEIFLLRVVGSVVESSKALDLNLCNDFLHTGKSILTG